MLKFTAVFLLGVALPHLIHAQQHPFRSVSSQAITLSEPELASMETKQDPGTVLDSGRSLVFSARTVTIVIRTGPSDDMLSYRIQGLRNPTLDFRPGVEVHLLLANMDDDMHHDLRFGRKMHAYMPNPDTAGTVGTHRLAPSQSEKFSAEEIVFRSVDTGTFSYFCSVKGHAAGGMSGHIVIGSNPASLAAMLIGQSPMKMRTTDAGSPMDMKQSGMEMKSGTMMDSSRTMKPGMNMEHSMNGPASGVLLTEPMS